MLPNTPPDSSWIARFGDTVRSWFRRAPPPQDQAALAARFRLLYERFREILAANDSTLELIADIEASLAGQTPISIESFADRVRSAALHSFVMVKNLNLLDGGRHADLYEALKRINAAIEAELPPVDPSIDGPLVVRLHDVTPSQQAIVGPKMWNLARVHAELGLPVPPGFVVTAAAYARFMTAIELWGRLARLGDLAASADAATLGEACAEVVATIVGAALPHEIESQVLAAFDELGDPAMLVAVRSSTLGEDKAASHAGQYESLLGVSRERLMDAYKRVVASVCAPSAVAYRKEHSVVAREAWMAVGVMKMVAPRCSGVMFSRDFRDLTADRVAIAATPGLAAAVAAGTQNAWEIVLGPATAQPPLPSWLDSGTLVSLRDHARRIEALFGAPQDIEWALSDDGELFVIQARPMRLAEQASATPLYVAPGVAPLLAGGVVACRGVVTGPVHKVVDDADLDRMPDGAVLVARHSSPTYSRVMRRCAAIVTEEGSAAGHMAILSREAGVPTIVGLPGALTALRQGMDVTVDAVSGAVYRALDEVPRWAPRESSVPQDTPARATLRRVAQLVTPLYLVDPASPDFAPRSCRTLHDILRYVHEKSFAAMFHFGDRAEVDRSSAVRLEARLPFDVLVYDVGGGIVEDAAQARAIRPEMIASAPLVAFLRGMLDSRLRWDRPRPVSASGFLSVLGESMIGPPPESQQLGRVSYVICADRYMNFSTKAGYHFSTVDTWCGASVNKNYIHFRFSGGGAAADRRARRIDCLARILDALEFKLQRRGDMLVARLAKFERDTIVARLADLGRLTICARQLDMLMDSDASPAFFASAFLRGEMDKFF
jgi:pyruvate,water dikinase